MTVSTLLHQEWTCTMCYFAKKKNTDSRRIKNVTKWKIRTHFLLFTSFLISTFISDDEKKKVFFNVKKFRMFLRKLVDFCQVFLPFGIHFLALTFEVELGKELFSIFKQQKTMVFRNNLSILKKYVLLTNRRWKL